MSELSQTPFWRTRCNAFRVFMHMAMWCLPSCRYKRELSAAHWTLSLRVQAYNAAMDQAELDIENGR